MGALDRVHVRLLEAMDLYFFLSSCAASRKLTHGHDSHYSPDGNAIYAEALAPLVIEVLR